MVTGMRRAFPGLILLSSACLQPPAVPEPGPTVPSEPGWEFGAAVECSAPEDAFSVLEDRAEQRGVDRAVPPATLFGPPGHFLVGVLIADVDADGDLDLAFNRPDTALDLYVNDGLGGFAYDDALFAQPDVDGEDPLAQAFVDIDGDGLPELFQSSFAGLSMRRGVAPLEWGPRQFVWSARGTQYEWAAWQSFSAGDLDGDGDLDLVLASVHGAFDPFSGDDEPPPGEAELILFGDGSGGFSEPRRLVADEGVGMSQLIFMTDRDADGDVDIFVGADVVAPGRPPSTVFDNLGVDRDGALVLADVGQESGGGLEVSHMGADGSDLNGDGVLDYCFSDVGPVVCLESDPSGVYVDTRTSRGLVPASMDVPSYWTGWSLEIADLDNDGLEDLVVAAGRVDDFIADDQEVKTPWESDQPNGIWQATARGQWEERTDPLDFGSIRESYGLATADLDGDGSLEVVIGNETGVPSLWWGGCSAGAWLEVDLEGSPGNVDALGAAVIIEDGDERWIQEVYSLRTVGQGPPQLHFGLGDRDTVERVTVRWPGGATSVVTDVPTRRSVRVIQADAR